MKMMPGESAEKICYLMRGMPSCGKSYTARKLAGKTGFVAETDKYFYTECGDDPTKFDYDGKKMPAARDWNYKRFCAAIETGISPVVVDRGCGLTLESKRFARYAFDRGYKVLLAYPESPWWNDIQVLLKYKPHTLPALHAWAEKLSKMSRATHRVPVKTIRHWMEKWNPNVTIEDILNFEPPPSKSEEVPSQSSNPS